MQNPKLKRRRRRTISSTQLRRDAVVKAATPSSLSSSSASSISKKKERQARKNTSKLLAREEEVQFSFQIRTMRAAMRLRDQMLQEAANTGSPSPTEDEWAEACGTSVSDLKRLLYEGQEARTALCNANVGLVTNIAKRHYNGLQEATRGTDAGAGYGSIGSILTLQDFIQEGNLGLMTAAERFDPEKGFRFSAVPAPVKGMGTFPVRAYATF